MKIGGFVRILLAVFALLLVYAGYQLLFPWQEHHIDTYTVRQNKLTAIVEVKEGDKWTRLQDDPYAEAIPADKLPYIVIRDIAWGPGGLLCFRMENRTKDDIKGRLALHLVLWETKRQMRVRDRSLRANLILPAGKAVPIVIDSNLTTPEARKIRTVLTVQPTSYSGE